MERDIKIATEAGERNLATMQLVRNWCAHARIKKFGGTGLIEQATGLPIGNHGLECDHATAGGMFTWDFREAALDFYDRNCADCKKRKGVGIPNLLSLVKERDDQRAAEAQRASFEQARHAEAHDARKLVRSRLREGLGPLACAMVDHIDEFDEQRDQESHTRFGSPGLLRTGLKSLDLKDDALLAAWRARVIQRADVVGAEIRTTFDHLDISWLADLVHLSVLPEGPMRALHLAQEKGIVVIIEPQLKGLRLDGAAFLSGGTPIIGLTLRNDRLDNFWYTLLHELAHVYLHYLTGLAAGFFDEELEGEKTDDLEIEADQFASSALIPPEAWRLSPARISRSAGPIEGFANQLGIHPAIVFGRVRRERNNYSIFSDRVGFGVVRKQLSST